MKKLVLTIAIILSSFSFANATPKSKQVIMDNEPNFCWYLAGAIEEAHCGSPGCDFDWFDYAFENCMQQ